jgi:hypothetical protein
MGDGHISIIPERVILHQSYLADESESVHAAQVSRHFP